MIKIQIMRGIEQSIEQSIEEPESSFISQKNGRNKSLLQIISQQRVNEDVKVYLDNQHCPMLLKLIKDTKFYALKDLSLVSNSIASIEGLSCFMMPQLQKLNLSYNNLVSLQPLRKCNIKNLIFLDFSSNCELVGLTVKQIDYVHAPQLKDIKILSLFTSMNPSQYFGIQAFCKVESNQINKAQFQHHANLFGLTKLKVFCRKFRS